MELATDPPHDWRNAAAYRALLDIDRAGIAWEWLRRDPSYIAFSREHLPDAGLRSARGMFVRTEANALRWGLHFRRAA
jgi:hypothetical protein